MEAIDAFKNEPGALVPTPNDSTENDYAWLDIIDGDNCFMPLELSNSRPSKSLDFGSNGYTGSLSTWHELLQITAPDPECGLVFVRGDFPDIADSILARAQRRNQKGTFGMSIRIPDNAEWVQEATPAQGLINLRWPFTRLDWVRTKKSIGSAHFASYTVCSFVNDGTVYQIARIMPKKLTTSSPSLSSDDLYDDLKPSISTPTTPPKSSHTVKFAVDVGGVIRFGCPSSAVKRASPNDPTPTTVPPPFFDKYTKTPDDGKPAYVFTCTSEVHEKRLEIRVWIDRKPQKLRLHECKSHRLSHGNHPVEYPHEVCALHVLKEDIEFDEDRPMVIVSSFSLVDSHAFALVEDPLPVINYEEVQYYLGVADPAPLAPYRLWSTMTNPLWSVDAFQLNATGRAVENVMGVASLPVSSIGSAMSPGRMGVALLKNIVTPQVVDLESTFWQVRLLVKAARWLENQSSWSSRHEMKEKKMKHFQKMQVMYRNNIVERVGDVCVWVLRLGQFIGQPGCLQDAELGILASDVLDRPINRRKCKPQFIQVPENLSDRFWRGQNRLQEARTRDQKYYCAVILWFVLGQLPEVFEKPHTAVRDLFWANFSGFESIKDPDRQGGVDRVVGIDDPNGCLIRWYHNFSFVKICETLQRLDQERFAGYGIQLETSRSRVREWQVKAEKSMRLFYQGRLSGRDIDHETANLTVLGPELDIGDKPVTATGKTCLELAKDLVRRRRPTEKLNAGRSRVLRWDSKHDVRSAKPRPPPWELNCLSQHLPLNLDVVQSEERELCQEKCEEFMFTDYTFMASWNSSKPTTVGHWWDFITSSIVCAKMLDDGKLDGKLRSLGYGENEKQDILGTVSYANIVSALGQMGSEVHQAGTRPGKEHHPMTLIGQKQLDMLRRIHAFQQESSARFTDTFFDWRKRKPRMVYNSDTTVQSLEDTPGIYRIQQTSNVRLRPNIARYMESNIMPEPDYSLDTIKERVGASKLHHLSCFDLVMKADRSDLPEISEPIARGRAYKTFWDNWAKSGACEREKEQREDLLALFDTKNPNGSSLMDLYLIGKPDQHPAYKKEIRNHPLLGDVNTATDLLSQYQESLFTVLNDSLIDQGVKYRLLFAKHLSPATLQAMVYMWHPDALDMFDDHLGDLSSFFDTTNQSLTGSEDTWISSITLKHWRLLDDVESKVRKAEKDVDKEERKSRLNAKEQAAARRAEEVHRKKGRRQAHESEDNADKKKEDEFRFPPQNVPDQRLYSETWAQQDYGQLSRIHELALSLVITGDEKGRNWTCSIICELFNEEDVANYASEVSHILQMFIHQQYTGRVLVFLLLLGYICERLAEECDRFMNELDGVMGMHAEVLLDGMNWEKSDLALKKLKQMLWGFEALRVFGDKLKKALDEVNRAESKMKTWLEKGKENRHKDMVSGAEQVKEEFEKRHSRLKNAHSSLQQRIDQGTKLREGISSVLSVEQNENISMLTWLTIIYLPPAFLTGVFGMGHNVVPESEGLTTFGWILGVMIFATIIFALGLRFMIEKLRGLGRMISRLMVAVSPERLKRKLPSTPADLRIVQKVVEMETLFHVQRELPNDKAAEIDVENGNGNIIVVDSGSDAILRRV